MHSTEWYQENQITLKLNNPVTQIDTKKQLVFPEKGESVKYDFLILATGSVPFVPDLPGIKGSDIYTFRTLADITTIRASAAKLKSAAVIGGGLLGLEAAKSLQDMGLETHVIEISDYLMPQQLDSQAGELLSRQISDLGICVHLKSQTSNIVHSPTGEKIIHFTNGKHITVNMIVVSIGITSPKHLPFNTEEIKVNPRGRILINDHLESTAKNVFAIGECAHHRGTTYGLVGPGYHMAEVLISNFLQKPATFSHPDTSTRLKVFGIQVTCLGDSLQKGEIHTWTESNAYRKIILDQDKKLIGALSIGNWPDIAGVQQAIAKSWTLDQIQINNFVNGTSIWPPTDNGIFQSLPVDSKVCQCMGISKKSILMAYQDGCRTTDAIIQKTGASTVCGSCRPLIDELTQSTPIPAITLKSRSLIRVSILAGLTLGLIIILPSYTYTHSVQNGLYQFEQLWRNPIMKQVTGYTILILCLIALLFSLRKRIAIFNKGTFNSWRLVHTLTGTLTLFFLMAHTGLHMGDNLNFYLMMIFCLLNLAGALTGYIHGKDLNILTRHGVRLFRIKSIMTYIHIILFLPLPALLGAHIWKVYYF